MGAHSRPEPFPALHPQGVQAPQYDFRQAGPDLVPPYPLNYPLPPQTPDQEVATEVVQAVVPTVAPVIGPLIAGAVKEAVARTFAKARKFVAAGAAVLLAGSGGAAYLVIQQLDAFTTRQDEIGDTTRSLKQDVQDSADDAEQGVTALQKRLERQLALLEAAANQRFDLGGQIEDSKGGAQNTQPGSSKAGHSKAPSPASARVPTAAPNTPTPTPDPVLDAYCQLSKDPIRC